MKNLIDEDSIKVLQIRWENIPGRKMMPELETDDPELHINLIIKELKKVVRNKKSNRFKVQETWFCLLQANKPLESCSVHDSQTRHGASHDLGEFRKENFVTFSWKRNGKLISPILNNRSNHRWQEESIDAWVSHGRVGIIQAVTGSGKSRVGTLAVAEALEDGYAVLLVVPTRVLADQWITDNLESFWEQGKLNRIGNTTTELDVPEARTAISGTLTVAVKSASAVDAVDQWISQAPRGTKMMILADEVHHLNGGMYTKFLRPEFDRRLGLTATLLPYEYDESKLKNFFMGDPIYDYDFNSAKRDNVITQYDLVMLGVNISEESQTIYQELEFEWRKSRDRLLTVTGKKIEASRLLEFGKNLLENEKFANDAKRFVDSHYALDDFINENALKSSTKAMGLISPLIKKYGRTALFCDFRDSAENVRQILSHRGVNAAIMTGSTDFGDREKLFKQLDAGDGELHAIAAPRVLDEGVDIQRLTIGCFVGRIRNRRMLIQRLGRVLRRHREKEKAFAIIIYIIGTEDDPDFQNRANERLVFSEFDFVGRNASQIRHFRVGEDDAELNQYLATL
jgi:RNA polymerase primary sigma factor